MAVVIDQERCQACGACVDVCATDALTENKPAPGSTAKATVTVDADLCADCGACLSECKEGAISPG